MKKILFYALVLSSVFSYAQNKSVIYYGDWSVWAGQGNFYPKNISGNLYTHLNFAFLDFDSNGNLILTDPDSAFSSTVGESFLGWGEVNSGIIPALAALKAKNPNLKLGVSLGGWSKSKDFAPLAANAVARAKFISNVIHFVKNSGMDYVDVDWEYPTSVRQADLVDNTNDEGTPNATLADKNNFLTLLTEFRVALNQLGGQMNKTYELSIAVHGTSAGLQAQMDIQAVSNVVDFINLMTYDFTGAFSDHTGHQTPLYSNPAAPTTYSIDEVVQYCLSKGVPSGKLNIGSAFYTRGWGNVSAGSNTVQPGLFMPAEIAGQDADGSSSRGAQNDIPIVSGQQGRLMGLWPYRKLEILKSSISDLTEYWDDIAKAPYMYSASTRDFYTYDNQKSIREKIKYTKNKQLGGVISWMASHDKPTVGDYRNELSTVIKNELFGVGNIPFVQQGELKISNIELARTIGSTDYGQTGFIFTIKNNETLGLYNGGNDALKGIDNFYSTIKKARFVITMIDGSTLSSGGYSAGDVSISGNSTIVNIASNYNGKYIKPGNSYIFKLRRNDAVTPNWNQVAKVEMLQYYDDTIILSRQNLYTNGTLFTDEKIFSNQTNLYPNPVNAGEEVKLSKKLGVEIFDMVGSIVASYRNVDSFKAPSTSSSYLIKMKDGNKVIIKKLVVKDK